MLPAAANTNHPATAALLRLDVLGCLDDMLTKLDKLDSDIQAMAETIAQLEATLASATTGSEWHLVRTTIETL